MNIFKYVKDIYTINNLYVVESTFLIIMIIIIIKFLYIPPFKPQLKGA